MLKKILKPLQIKAMRAEKYRIIDAASMKLMVEGNTSMMPTSGNKSNPSSDCDALKPLSHKSVLVLSLNT